MDFHSRSSTTPKSYLVIGLGRFGSSLAIALQSYGHTVLALDRDPDRVQRYSSALSDVRLCDATRLQALEEMSASQFDTGIACIGNDFASNLIVTALLKRLGVKKAIAKASTTVQRDILLRAGADEVLLPEQEAGIHLGRRLMMGMLQDFLEINDGVGLMKMAAPPTMWNQTLEEYQLRRRYHLTAVAVYREDHVIVNPGPDLRVREHDILMLLGSFESAYRVWESQKGPVWLPWR